MPPPHSWNPRLPDVSHTDEQVNPGRRQRSGSRITPRFVAAYRLTPSTPSATLLTSQSEGLTSVQLVPPSSLAWMLPCLGATQTRSGELGSYASPSGRSCAADSPSGAVSVQVTPPSSLLKTAEVTSSLARAA